MHMPLVGSTDRALWGSQTEARFVNSNQKEWSLGELHGPGRQGRMFTTRAFGGVILGT